MAKKKSKMYYERQDEPTEEDTSSGDDLMSNADAGQESYPDEPEEIEPKPDPEPDQESSRPVTSKVEEEMEAEFLEKKSEYKPPISRQDSARLKCLLTDSEKQARGKELAEAVLRKHELEQELDQIKKHYATDIKAQDAAIDRLQNIVNSGAEFREVATIITHDYLAGTILSMRIDTGEIFDTRTMTSNERQMSLI